MHAITSVQSYGCSQAGENVPEAIRLVVLDYTGRFFVSAPMLKIPILTS